jgi:hypothetical protein
MTIAVDYAIATAKRYGDLIKINRTAFISYIEDVVMRDGIKASWSLVEKLQV